MNAKLQLLQRKMQRENPERIPAPETSGGIGAAIEQLIADEVSQRVTEAVVEKKNRHLDRLFKPEPVYTDYRALPVTPRTRTKAPFSCKVHRDAAGLLLWTEAVRPDGSIVKVKIIRDGAGLMIGAEEISESPMLPAPDIAYEAEAREYDPGTPRG